MSSETDQRIAELATGFALGELTDAELSELHDALKQPGEIGVAAAGIAWEVLGTCMDLRVQLGSAFLDTLRLRLSEGNDDASGTFKRGLLARLCASRPQLEAVPMPSAGKPPSRVAITIAALMVAALVLFVILRDNFSRDNVAQISDIIGSASLNGKVLSNRSMIDRGWLVIPDGSQIVLSWPDGASAVIAGPANVVAQTRGLSLSSGRAWVSTAHTRFTIGVPDRTSAIELAPESRGVIQITTARSLIGVLAGSAQVENTTVTAQQAIGHSGQPYAWHEHTLKESAVGEIPAVAGEWQWAGDVAWANTDAMVEITVECGPGQAVVIRTSTTGWSMTSGKQEIRSYHSGPPLITRPMVIRGDSTTITANVSGRESSLQLPASATLVRWSVSGTARIEHPTFHTGPEFVPPLPLPKE